MKPIFVFSVSIALISILTFVLLIPVSSNFLRYLWWKTTSAAISQHGDIKSGETRIHYVVYGHGSPLLLLHGGLSHRLSWFSQVPWLVASGRQVILMDSRGHGKSSLGKKELSYRLLAQDVIHVLDALAIKKTDVIGWSDGANTALLLACYWPRRVAKIIALSANSDPTGLSPEAQKENPITSNGLRYWWYRWWTGAGARINELDRRLRKLWRERPRLQATDLQTIQAATLVIVGENDLISLDHARQMVHLLPHGTLEVIPGGGHASHISHAQQVNMLIKKFLDI